MSPVQLLVLSIALGTDLFSTAIPLGMMRWSGRRLLQASLVFAWFHIMMILAGYGLGHWLGSLVETLERGASGFGAVILILLGICLVKEGGSDEPTSHSYSLVGWKLIFLAISVSVDAFAAGVSLGMLDVDLLLLCLILGGVIFAMSLIGLRLGRQIGSYAGPYALRAGGILLALFGFHALSYLI